MGGFGFGFPMRGFRSCHRVRGRNVTVRRPRLVTRFRLGFTVPILFVMTFSVMPRSRQRFENFGTLAFARIKRQCEATE